MRQRRGSFRGWEFIATRGQGGGIGVSWHRSRFNGITLFLGPIILDIVPPLPKSLAEQIE